MYTKIETRMNLPVESKSVKIFDCPKGKYPDISSNNIAYKQSNLYIYYNASGSLADNWINKNVAIIARFSEIP